MKSEVSTANFSLAGSEIKDAPVLPPQAQDRIHFWTRLLRFRLVWPWKKADVSQLQARELSLHSNPGNGEVTETPLSTSGVSSNPSRERGGPDDQDHPREDAGRINAYSNIMAQGNSCQHNGNTTSNGNTTYIVNGPSTIYNS
jgi:hypothetical protein